MAANNSPIYPIRGDQSTDNSTGMPTVVTGASGDYDGTGSNNVKAHTAGSSGSFARSISFVAVGTNVASVARVYLNNGSTHGTGSNNVPLDQVSLPAITASNTAATVTITLPINKALKSGWQIWWGLGTAVAAGWVAVVDAGQYE